MKLIRAGVHLPKSVLQGHGVERSERTTWRRRLRREEWIGVIRSEASFRRTDPWQRENFYTCATR